MTKTAKFIAVNDRGLAIGESHPRAVLSDHDVGLLLELRDEGYSYGWLAEKFEVSKSCVAKIVRGEHRAQIVVGFRRAKPVVNDGVAQAAKNSKAALGVSNSGITLCMEPRHLGVNVELPIADRVQMRPGVWVCNVCAARAARHFRRARGGARTG